MYNPGKLHICRALAAEEQGSVAILFAILTLVLFTAIGVSVDLAAAHRTRTALDSAADAAALAAVRAAKAAIESGRTDWQALAEQAGSASFQANSSGDIPAKVRDVTVVVERTGDDLRGRVDYRATEPMKILMLLGREAVEVSNSSQAAFSMARYTDVSLLIDVSPSMGIGSTLADQTILQNGIGCALACHYRTPGGLDNYAAARATGAVLRIDVVKQAVRDFITAMKAKAKSGDEVRISITLFSNQLIPIFAASTDLDAALAATSRIDLVSLPYNEGTNVVHALNQLAAALGESGDGLSPDRRKSYVLLATDGIENSTYGLPSGTPGVMASEIIDPNFVVSAPSRQFNTFEFVQAFQPGACTALKDKGHTMLVAQIDYLIPPPWNAGSVPRFSYIESSLKSVSDSSLQACASAPSYARKAVHSDEISPMFADLLERIRDPSHLRLVN